MEAGTQTQNSETSTTASSAATVNAHCADSGTNSAPARRRHAQIQDEERKMSQQRMKRFKMMSMLLPNVSGSPSAPESGKEPSEKKTAMRAANLEQLNTAMSNYISGHVSSTVLLSRIDSAIKSREAASISQGINVLRSLLYVCAETRRKILGEAVCNKRSNGDGLPQQVAVTARASEEATTGMSMAKAARDNSNRDADVTDPQMTVFGRIISLLREEARDGCSRGLASSLLSVLQLLAGAADVAELDVFVPLVYSSGGERVLMSLITAEAPDIKEAALKLAALIVRNRSVLEAACTDIQEFLDPIALCLSSEVCLRCEQEAALSILSTAVSRFKDGVEVLFGAYEEAGGTLWVPLGHVVVKEVEFLRDGMYTFVYL
jgi:hypothetical protein